MSVITEQFVVYHPVLFLTVARRMAAARKMKQLRGENPDDTEQNDDDLLSEMTPGEYAPGA